MLKLTDIPVTVAPTGTQATFKLDIAPVAELSGTATLIGPEDTTHDPGAFEALIRRTAGSPKHIDTGFGEITGGGGVAFTFTVAVLVQPPEPGIGVTQV